MTPKNTHSSIRALGASLVLIGLLAACSKEPAQAPAPTPVPPSVANGAQGAPAAQGSAPAAPGTPAAAPAAPTDNNTVAGVQFPPPNAKTSEHPLYVQPKEPVLQTDGSLRAAFEGTFR